jgi:hypothetical protein
MTKMKACWRLAASALGLALLGITVAFAQTAPPAAAPSKPASSNPAPPSPAPANNDQAPVPGTLSAVPQASSGQGGDDQNNGNFTIKTNVNEVNLIFTVTDKHGRFIPPSRPTCPCGSAS